MSEIPENDAWLAGFRAGRRREREWMLEDIRLFIQSDLDGSQTLHLDLPGLRKALLIIERMGKTEGPSRDDSLERES